MIVGIRWRHTRVIAATRSQTMNPNPDVVVFYMQICPMGQPQEAESPRRCTTEMISSGPWPETEINTTSGDEATPHPNETSPNPNSLSTASSNDLFVFHC